MRSVSISGLSLAIGIMVSPVLAQDARSYGQPLRGAQLGGPIAIQQDAGVMPAGLLAAGQAGSPIPTPMPMPMQPGGIPAPGSTPLPPPTPVPTAPSVTEVRNPDGLGLQTYPQGYTIQGLPQGYTFQGVPQGYPIQGVPMYGGGLVPEPVPTPDGLLAPNCLQGLPPTDCGPEIPAVERVKSCDRWWVSSEYLMWWTRSMQVPTLLTTSAPADFGILGAPTTRPLFGGDVGDTFHSGTRFSVGHWFNNDPSWGLEGRIFFLDNGNSSFSANSGQYPVLARPFYNVNSPVGPFSELVAYPGLASGAALIRTQTALWGAEANVRKVLFGSVDGQGFELDAIAGYRFMELDERLSIDESFARTPGSNMGIGTPAISGNVGDVFRTYNSFNGGQIGLNASYQYGRWFIDSRTTVAFGDLEQTANINGGQTLYFANGAVGKYAGGLLALPGANIGIFHHSQFAVLPETSLNLGYQVTSHMRLFLGYDFLFLGNALRPGGAIDTSIDAARIPNFPLPGSPTPLPGAPRPGPYFTTSNFFAQGINFGMEFRW